MLGLGMVCLDFSVRTEIRNLNYDNANIFNVTIGKFQALAGAILVTVPGLMCVVDGAGVIFFMAVHARCPGIFPVSTPPNYWPDVSASRQH